MSSIEIGRRGQGRGELYLDMVDLYAARAVRGRTVVATDPIPIRITPIGRHRSARTYNGKSHGQFLHSRKVRFVSISMVVLIALSFLVRTALADQTYRVQNGDTIHKVADRFNVDAQALVEENDLWDVEYLYPGQELTIPGIADADVGTGYVSGTYRVKAGDTVASIALDLNVNGADLVAINDLYGREHLYQGDVLYVPDESTSEVVASESTENVEPESTSGLPSTAFVWVPNYYQQRNLSCEYASAFIATSAFGSGVPESAFWNWIPVTSNPHWGYRGNIDGWWGNTYDYGIYPEPLVPVLNYYGYGADVFYGGSDASSLMQQLAWGRPVVVWLAMWGNTAEYYADEGAYAVFSGMHVMTAYGYDEWGVYLSDPATGSNVSYDWGTFLWMWGTIDGMALAVYPL